jgi:hypothetical protein
MKTYIVQLDSHDDVISTRDKISWSKARRVLLVWPRRGRVLTNRVDLILLQRHSQQLGLQMAVVTRRADVRQNAHELGIPVFSKPVQAQQVAWRRPNPPRRSFRSPDESPPDPQELRKQRDQFTDRPLLNRWVRLGTFVCGVLAFLILALFFVPDARVELTPQRQQQTLSIAAWAGPQVAQPGASGGMPAYPLQVVVEGRETAESSGLVLMDDQAASGRVQFTNLTDQALSIPAGTPLLTLGQPPVRFLTTGSVDMPAGPGQVVVAAVKAEVPGSAANVAAGQVRAIEGDIGLRVSVDNPQALTGGSERRSPAPSAQDYRKLHDKLLSQLQLTALEELQARLQPGQRLLFETIRLVEEVAEERQPEIGQPADQLQLTLRVAFEGWTVEERDVQVVAQAALNANLTPGFHPVDETLRADFEQEPALDKNGVPRWTLHATRTLEADWSAEQAAQMIRGLTPPEAVERLQSAFRLAGPPRIMLIPQWWFRLPFLPFRITVVQP